MNETFLVIYGLTEKLESSFQEKLGKLAFFFQDIEERWEKLKELQYNVK